MFAMLSERRNINPVVTEWTEKARYWEKAT